MDGLRLRKRAATRSRIVDEAFGLFEQRGVDNVTVAEICTAADIAPRTFFRYFPSKDDLLAEPARQLGERLRQALCGSPPDASTASVLRAALLAVGAEVVADTERSARLFRVLRTAARTRPYPLFRLADREYELADLLSERAGRDGPGWPDRLDVARAIAALRIWLDDVVDGADGDPLTHLREILDR